MSGTLKGSGRTARGANPGKSHTHGMSILQGLDSSCATLAKITPAYRPNRIAVPRSDTGRRPYQKATLRLNSIWRIAFADVTRP